MLNTPKSIPRLSYTQSQSNFSVKSSFTQPRARHMSLQKTQKINYNMILNKMLAIENPQKFMSFASKFVDKQILQCKQQPTRHNKIKDISNYLISDGRFVRKLAQMSSNLLLVLKHFKQHIRTNKRMIKELHDKISNQGGKTQQDDQKQIQYHYSNNETQQDRNNRLNGFCKPQKPNEGAKQIKIDFSEYVKSNRKSMQIYQRIKKMTESQENHMNNDKKQQLKRQSLRAGHQKQNCMEQMTVSLVSQLLPIQQQIIKLFPSLKYMISRNMGKPQILHKIERIGTYKGFQICKVAIQINQWNNNHTKFDDQQNKTIIEHALTIQPISPAKQQNTQPNSAAIKEDRFIRIYLAN